MDESTLEEESTARRPLNEENCKHVQDRFVHLYRLLTTQHYPLHRIFQYFGLGMAVLLLIYLPWHTFRAIIREEDRPDEVAFTSAAVFVLLTLILSSHLIYSHLSNWYMPDVQK